MSEQARKALKYNTVEGAFAVASDNLSAPYLNLFALSLGANPFLIGLMNAIPSLLGNILQIPFALLTERTGRARFLVLLGGFGLRVTWALIAFLPFIVPGPMQIPLLITLVSLRIVFGSIATPAWTAVQADIVPKSMRGRYYSNRNMVLNVAGLVATFAANRILSIYYPLNYQALFFIAAVFGALASLSFAKIPLPQESKRLTKAESAFSLTGLVTLMKESQRFSGYCVSALIWNFGVMISSPLVSVHFVTNLGGNSGLWALVMASSMVSGTLFQRYWGRLADRFGQKNVMRISGFMVALIPLLWLVVPVSILAIGVNFIAGASWAGYNLGSFNLLLEVTPEDKRPRYVGVFNTLLGISVAISQLIGGYIATILGIPLLFVVATVIRLIGLFLLNSKVEDDRDPMPLTALLPFKRQKESLGLTKIGK